MPPKDDGQSLPKKEGALFRALVNHYEVRRNPNTKVVKSFRKR
jgi:hypothetical protein